MVPVAMIVAMFAAAITSGTRGVREADGAAATPSVGNETGRAAVPVPG